MYHTVLTADMAATEVMVESVQLMVLEPLQPTIWVELTELPNTPTLVPSRKMKNLLKISPTLSKNPINKFTNH